MKAGPLTAISDSYTSWAPSAQLRVGRPCTTQLDQAFLAGTWELRGSSKVYNDTDQYQDGLMHCLGEKTFGWKRLVFENTSTSC